MNPDWSYEECSLVRGERVHEGALESLYGWYPVLAEGEGLWWRHFGKKKFSEPFFHDTLYRVSRERRLSLHTDCDAPKKLERVLAPDAFIFHVSRCGSTLLTQMLAALPECIVLSEPPIIDSVLKRYYAGLAQDKTEAMLRNAVSALGQQREPEERHFFVKLDSWHIHSLPLLRNAFPDTPFLFLYRDPAEVIASHRRQRGRQMVPGLVNASMPPLDFELAEPGDLDSYCVKILEGFFATACRHAGELTFVDYRQLPQFAWDELPACLGLDFSPEQLAAMRTRAGMHSKNGGTFSGDPRARDETLAAGPELDALYARLEKLRLDQQPLRPA